MSIATLRVANGAGVMIINRVDFDPRIHDLHETETATAPTNAEIAANLAGDRGSSDNYGKPRTEFEPIEDRASGVTHRSTNQKSFDQRRAAILAELEAL